MRKCTLLLGLLLTSCGGSSSETPPPLEPDPTSFRYTGPRPPRIEDETPAPAAPEIDEDDRPARDEKKPASSTWGSGSPARSSSTAPAPNAAAVPPAAVPPAAVPPAAASSPAPAASQR